MTTIETNPLLQEVATYYSQKLSTYGQNAQGVDWNGAQSQSLRFEQLCKLITAKTEFSINDLGCGYGALYDFLATNYGNFVYSGIDVSEGMIQAAKQRYQQKTNVHFVLSDRPAQIADYGIASGIFNVRQNRAADEWATYIKTTLDILDATSRFGFSFNCLTSYSDLDKMRDTLYYADPLDLFHHCKQHYSRHVSLLHDYGLYEFTIIVRKN